MAKDIKVLFQSRLDLFDRPGGDTVQMVETQKALQKIGVKVDIDNTLDPDVSSYDIVHVFNIDWVCEPYWQVKNAKSQKKPAVLSPIHHSLKEYKQYEKNSRYGLAKVGNFLIPYQPLRDSARNLVKGLVYLKKLNPAIKQMFMGIRKQQRLSVEMSDYILVQTNRETQDLIEEYGVKDFKWKKVVNGVDVNRFKKPDFKASKKLIPENPYILCVGRIEPRKNQLKLIEAVSELRKENNDFKNVELFFAGSFNTHHPTYISKFKKLLNDNDFVHHPGFVHHDILAAVFAKAEIFAVPSWFETTGLVYLEAVAAGCKKVVASGERAKEYLGDNAVYCKPGSVQSIKKALVKTKKHTVSEKLVKRISKDYTWRVAAEQTLDVYKKVLR
jgi:glycosyltransferase involved in cell wall biosynthesis